MFRKLRVTKKKPQKPKQCPEFHLTTAPINLQLLQQNLPFLFCYSGQDFFICSTTSGTQGISNDSELHLQTCGLIHQDGFIGLPTAPCDRTKLVHRRKTVVNGRFSPQGTAVFHVRLPYRCFTGTRLLLTRIVTSETVRNIQNLLPWINHLSLHSLVSLHNKPVNANINVYIFIVISNGFHNWFSHW